MRLRNRCLNERRFGILYILYILGYMKKLVGVEVTNCENYVSRFCTSFPALQNGFVFIRNISTQLIHLTNHFYPHSVHCLQVINFFRFHKIKDISYLVQNSVLWTRQNLVNDPVALTSHNYLHFRKLIFLFFKFLAKKSFALRQ